MLRELTGVRIQVLRTEKPIVFCEDNLQQMMLEDILVDSDVKVIGLSGWDTVVRTVGGGGYWETLRSSATICCGVIDRDMNESEQIESFADKKVFCLPFYDSEALMLDPELGHLLFEHSIGRKPTTEEYNLIIVEAATRAKKSVLPKLKHKVSESCRPEIKYEIDSSTGAIRDIRLASQENAVTMFSREIERIDAALASKEISEILKCFYGKALYGSF